MKFNFSKSIWLSFFVGILVGAVIIFLIKSFTTSKNEILTLDLQVKNLADAAKFKAFLDERIEDNKIFQLNVSICYSTYDESVERHSFVSKLSQLSRFEYIKDDAVTGYPIVITTDNDWFTLTYPDVSDGVIYDNGNEFYEAYAFPESSASFYNIAYSDGLCDSLGINIDNYFIFKDQSSQRSRGAVDILAKFDLISKKEIELRKY